MPQTSRMGRPPVKPKPADANPVDIEAVREHVVGSKRTRAHVIVCHDLDARSHTLYEMFRFADRVAPDALDALVKDMATDIINDADMLIAELTRIKAWAEKQLKKAGGSMT